MSLKSKVHRAQDRMSSIRLANDPLRIPVEQIVSEHKGRRWTIKDARDMTEFACHHSAILSDGSYSVFAKLSEAANGLEQFEIELAGLRLLSEISDVLTPTPIGIIPITGGSILVLEAVQAVDRTPLHWRQIGQTLARIHRIKGDRIGLDTHGYFGPLYQENTPMSDWPTFYAERRLWPGLRLAIESGNMPSDVILQVEKLISRIPDLCGPETVPSLLHGDAQQNNFISTELGAVVIDPAVYYGNPEMDLAFIDYFQTVPDDVFDGYQDELPIDPGFRERRDLWRVWGYLAAVTVEGPSHLGKLTEAVQKYL
ncbi:MAG: fructosamine kinase family protein [Candidatus Promineifilaceae bacterium]